MTVTAGLSVGYVIWIARSGVLLSTALSSLPAWRFIDPLPVLSQGKAGLGLDFEEDDESLESIIVEQESVLHDKAHNPAEQRGANVDPSGGQ